MNKTFSHLVNFNVQSLALNKDGNKLIAAGVSGNKIKSKEFILKNSKIGNFSLLRKVDLFQILSSTQKQFIIEFLILAGHGLTKD